MNNVLNIDFLKRKKLSSLVGLAIDGSRLDGVVLRRTNGSLHQQQSFSVNLSLDPLTADAELVGREIRNHLDAAGVRERHCIVGVPLKWALTSHTEIPELPEADVAAFLHTEAERSFHSDVETLHLATSRFQTATGKKHALLVGIPKTHLERLEQVLRAAKLKPVRFSLGITALQPPAPATGTETAKAGASGVLALAIGETHVGVQVTCHGGVAALRALEGAAETTGSRKTVHADLVARETRITLGQLPAELRANIRSIRIFGPRDLASQLADEMELRFEAMDLPVEVVTAYAPDEFGVHLPPDTQVSREFSLAARVLAGRPVTFDFLPPKITALQQFTQRYSSGPLRTAGLVGGSIALLVIGAFAIQQWQLSSLQSQWDSMSARVSELDALQQKIQQFRPWYDDTVAGLSILKQLTEAFPEDGAVSAKTVEIRDLTLVTCTGTARDNPSLLATMARLRKAENVSGVKVDQIRGRSPMQFSFDFHWNGGGNEN
jgi:hypothetical protein